MARAVVIVQARMGSSRLPGKVLEDLAGHTVLWHVVQRCRAIAGAHEVCCAIPIGTSNDTVANEALDCGATVVRGSEKDVLARYHQAAVERQADVVMRVTSDCPLIDPAIASEVLRLTTSGAADYSANNMPRSWPHGLDCEAFGFAWLERAAREAKQDDEREHVTPFLRNHPQVRKVNLPGPGGKLAGQRWTLDTPRDLEFFRQLFRRMPSANNDFSYRVPLEVVEREPELLLLNAFEL